MKTHKFWYGLLIVLVFGSGIFIGSMYGTNRALTSNGIVDISKVIHLYQQSRSDTVAFDQFWRVWDTVKKKHVDGSADEVSMFYGAIKGMVESLDDPYSVYFPPAQAAEFASDLEGEFEGIGAEIGMKENQLIIISPLPESPAEKAGLKAGDAILAIDEEETFGFSLEEAVLKIRGKKGTTVTLTVFTPGQQDMRTVPVVRDTITIPTVKLEMKENNIAHLRIYYFNDETMAEFDKAVEEILSKKVTRMVLDLRGNPGGYLDASISVASEWIRTGFIVKEVSRDGATKEHRTSGRHRLAEVKTLVLVDEGTASGAEIVAGALQDHGVATLIGKKTFGKGSVQDFEVLDDGSALKLTIAEWLTPKDRHINKAGVVPDVVLEKMFDETVPEKPVDLGLQKAIELIQ